MYVKTNINDSARLFGLLKSVDTVLVVGAPCAGKGTLLSRLQIESFSTGDYYRKKAQENSTTKATVNSGKLMPDEETDMVIIRETAHMKGVKYIDGYPRTIQQAQKSLEIFGHDKIAVLYLNVDRKVCEKRSASRQVCKTCGEPHKVEDISAQNLCEKCGGKLVCREDEAEMPRRLDTFFNTTVKVIPFFDEQRVLIIEVNANNDVTDALGEFCDKLSPLLSR